MLNVELSQTTQCDCCGKDKLTKTFMIETYCGTVFLGYKCCGRWFRLNMSGNKFAALKRLEYQIFYILTGEELDEIFGQIRTAERTWQEEKGK